jgi:hypothetical protein
MTFDEPLSSSNLREKVHHAIYQCFGIYLSLKVYEKLGFGQAGIIYTLIKAT